MRILAAPVVLVWTLGAGVGLAFAEGLEPSTAPPRHEDLTPRGPSVEERLATIHARVRQVATYPPIARARAVTGETVVEFEIDPDGSPRDVRTAHSSGSESLDRAAERAVRDAAPLPRVVGSVRMPVRFQLTASE